ncbi:MAG: hypothetical protein JNK15_17505 [Planctomycetes bacterium]|nr:hypothetical protein [Planctomycetota bacterium]
MAIRTLGTWVSVAVALVSVLAAQDADAGVSLQPASHDLGEVAVGAVTEFSFGVHWPDDAAVRTEPEVRLPEGLHLLRVKSFREKDGKSTSVVAVALRVDHAGNLAARCEVRLGTRTATFPVQAKVVARPKGGTRVLVLESPFGWQSGDPEDFVAWRRLVAAAALDVDQRVRMRGRATVEVAALQRVDIVWIAEGSLLDLDAGERALLQGFVCGGGRLVVVASAFFDGTPAAASLLCEPFGLCIQDKEPAVGMAAVATGDGIARHPLTVGVESIRLLRPSPVASAEAGKATELVRFDGDVQQVFAAMATTGGGGEVVAVGACLWWNDLGRCPGFERLVRNLMSRAPRLR